MKLVSILFFLLVLPALSYSQSKIEGRVNLTGLWSDSNSTSFKNCYLIISQTGTKVSIAHYLEFEGTSMVEVGKGKVSGRKVTYKVKVTKAIPGWSTYGVHFLELSPDGQTLRGYYKDAKGNTGPIVFKRVG